MKDDKSQLVIRILVIVILILLALVVYAFAVKPAFNAYVIEKQIEASELVLGSLISQVDQNGYVEIVNGNDSLILVPYNSPQGFASEEAVDLEPEDAFEDGPDEAF